MVGVLLTFDFNLAGIAGGGGGGVRWGLIDWSLVHIRQRDS